MPSLVSRRVVEMYLVISSFYLNVLVIPAPVTTALWTALRGATPGTLEVTARTVELETVTYVTTVDQQASLVVVELILVSAARTKTGVGREHAKFVVFIWHKK